MVQITKEELQVLVDNGVIRNTNRGYVDPNKRDESGQEYKIGFYTTVNRRHRYIEDWYKNKATKLYLKGVKHHN